jgi:hypothetical protein
MTSTTDAGRLMPDPPPSTETCDASKRKTSATTQVPIAQAKDQPGYRDCHQCADQACDRDCHDWMDVQQHGEREQQIAAEPDKGLLSNRH